MDSITTVTTITCLLFLSAASAAPEDYYDGFHDRRACPNNPPPTSMQDLQSTTAACDPGDQKILLDVKASFLSSSSGGNINSSSYLSDWNPSSSSSCCSWYGVTCDAAGRTRILEIRKHPELSGRPIPRAIGRLTNLVTLRLDWNNLTGPVPDFLGTRLPLLKILVLSHNRLSGRIPPSLGTSKALNDIRLDHNQLTGRIPGSLAKSPLHNINLSDNDLAGTIPASFAALDVLRSLDLSNNRRITGGDPSMLFGAEKPLLLSLRLANINLNFCFTGKEILPPNIQELDLSNNMIHGSIPQMITELPYITNFNVSNNQLCGRIPFGGLIQEFNDQYNFFNNKCLCGEPLHPCN